MNEQRDAGRRFLAEFHKSYPVQVAFWLRESEATWWYLYVASEQITDDNFDVAYGEVLRVSDMLRDPWFDPFRVKLIGADDPLAKAALEMLKKYPGPVATTFGGKMLGGVYVDEMYIYPSPLPVSA